MKYQSNTPAASHAAPPPARAPRHPAWPPSRSRSCRAQSAGIAAAHRLSRRTFCRRRVHEIKSLGVPSLAGRTGTALRPGNSESEVRAIASLLPTSTLAPAPRGGGLLWGCHMCSECRRPRSVPRLTRVSTGNNEFTAITNGPGLVIWLTGLFSRTSSDSLRGG